MIYRPIPGFPDCYAGMDGSIVRCGDPIKSWVKDAKRGKKYVCVRLRDETGRWRIVYVHKLVMLAYRGPRPNGLQTLHADDDGGNNALVNLSYGTQSDNWRDRKLNGRDGWGNRPSCKYGHPYTEANTRIRKGTNTRICRRCRIERKRGRRTTLP